MPTFSILQSKRAQPNAVYYNFYLEPKKPGVFMMAHIFYKDVIKEPIEVRER